MTISSSCVAVFSPNMEERINVFDTLESLLSINYSINNLSVLGKGTFEDGKNAIGVYKVLDQTHFKGEQNKLWQGLWEILAGEAFLYIPTFGSLVVAGGLSTMLMSGNGEKLYPHEYTELGNVLHRVGIPERSICHYESLLKQGWLILIVNGNNYDVENACLLLENSQSNHEVSLHFANTS
jgi:hypothetical protein